MTGGKHPRGPKSPEKKNKRPRPPLSENGQAENISSEVRGRDEDIAKLKSLNLRLITQINDEREKNRGFTMKEEALLECESRLKDEIAVLVSEKNRLEAEGLQLREEMQKEYKQKIVQVEIQVREQAKMEFEEEIQKKEKEWRTALLQSQIQFKEEMINKEEECQTAMSEKNDLQIKILELKEQLQMMCEQSERDHMAKESEKEKLLAEILTARKDKEEIERGYGLLQEKFEMKEEESKARISEKDNMEVQILELQEQLQIVSQESKKACMSVEAENHRLLAEVSEVRKKVELRDRSNATFQERLANKEKESQAMLSETKSLQNEILMLKEQMHMMSKGSEATQITLEAEKDKLLSQVLAAKNDAENKAKNYKLLQEKMAKEKEESQTMISEKNNLEAKVLQFQEQLDIMSRELETTHMSAEVEKDRLLTQVVVATKNRDEMDRYYELLQEEVAKKEEEWHALNSEKTNLKAAIIQLKEQKEIMSLELKAAMKSSELQKGKLLSELMAARKDAEDMGKSNATLHEKNAIKEAECQAIILEKETLGAEILQLKEQMNVMYKEKEAVQKSYDAEKDQLLSQVMEVKKESQEMGKMYEILQGQMARKEDECRSVILDKTDLEATFLQLKENLESAQLSWEAEKDKLSSQVLSARKDSEMIGVSYEMLQKSYEADKENLLSELSKCEEEAANICKKKETVICELSLKYKQLYTANEFLKAQLDEYHAILGSVEDDRKMDVTRVEAVLSENRTLKEEIDRLQLKIGETNKQHSDLNHKYETSLKEITQLRKDTDKLRFSLEKHVRLVEEQTTEIVGLKNRIEELRASLHDMQEKHATEVQVKGLLSKKFESLHTEFTQKCRDFDEKETKLLKENEEQIKVMESLHREKAILGSEKGNVECILEGATKRCEDIQEKYLQSNARISELEVKISELHRELGASRSLYDAVTAEINNVKEVFNNQQDEICQFATEKALVDVEMPSHISTNKALKKEFLSANFSLAELRKQFSRLTDMKNKMEKENSSLQEEVRKLALALEQKNQDIKELESSCDDLNKDIQGKAISTSKLMPKKDKKQQMMNCSLSAWVASAAFAVAGLAITAYLKLS